MGARDEKGNIVYIKTTLTLSLCYSTLYLQHMTPHFKSSEVFENKCQMLTRGLFFFKLLLSLLLGRGIF